VSRKRSYDYNETNDEQPSAAAESSNAAGATVELESTRRTSLAITACTAAAVGAVVSKAKRRSRKRSYDYNESNYERPSAAADRSNSAGATAELKSTRRMSLRTKNAVKYSEMDEEVASSSSMSEEETSSPSMSETEAEAAPATTSKSTNLRKKVYK
jgi:hypothetical protein